MTKYLALGALILLAGCSGAPDATAEPDPVALVSLGSATNGQVAQTVTLYGAVERGAEAQYALSAPVEASVVAITAPVGTAVRGGQIIARLSPGPTVRADYAKAISDANANAQALARAQRLRADGLGSDADVEAARAAAHAASAQRSALASGIRGLTLVARSGGHVETVPVNVGDIVSAGATIATLSRDGALRARFGIAPDAARAVTPGTMVQISSDGGAHSIAATIQSVDTVVDPQTKLASIFVQIAPGQGIAAGQPLTAIVPVAQGGNGVTIPYAAMLDDGGQPYVYVVQNGVAHRRDVVTGAPSGDRIVIVKGVAPGERVVTKGGTAVEDGMKVRTQ